MRLNTLLITALTILSGCASGFPCEPDYCYYASEAEAEAGICEAAYSEYYTGEGYGYCIAI